MFRTITLLCAVATALVLGPPAAAHGGATLFVTSATENADDTVTLPLYAGASNGQWVKFVVLDASTGDAADDWGVNRSQKLANAGDAAVDVTVANGVIQFPATADFSPNRFVVPSATGFPPVEFAPGAVGQAGYSPLIRLPDGTILNAPHVANASGLHDKVAWIGTTSVRLQETHGFQGGRAVKYVSTDSSHPLAAALEGATFAPQLAQSPTPGGDGTDSSRASLVAFVNGQTGAANPQRQGLNSAVLDGLDPLNVLSWNPSQGRYSPLWDPGGGAWGAADIVVNCPIISREG